MRAHGRWPSEPALHLARALSRPALAVSLVAALTAAVAHGREYPPFGARAGLDMATAAADAWSPDAVLVYVENDEDVNDEGAASRWGYLFHSESLARSRVYSVRDGKILVAENLDMKFESPPVAGEWIDSQAALAAADHKAGRAFREKHQGRPGTMLLMRGAFHDGDPDRTTWTIVYTSPSAPALFVVVDAEDGKVRRTWRG